MRNAPILATSLSLVALSCGGAPPSQSPATGIAAAATPETSSPTPHTAAAKAADDAPSEEWKCGNELVPPNGWEQDTAFEDANTPNARERASQAAVKKLGERLCRSGDCEYLQAHIAPWKTGTNGREVCAMAVVKQKDLEEWRSRSRSLMNLDVALEGAAAELTKAVGKHAKVAIAEIVDMGIAGGDRAEWLKARMARMLERDADVVDVPKGWAGNRTPAGVAMVIRAQIVARSERGIAMLEVTWDGVRSSGAHTHTSPVAFPESASPHAAGPAMVALPQSEGLNVRLDSSRGGSLCVGERSQIWLESEKDAAAIVLDLYGDNEAMVVFPNDEHMQPNVNGGETLALGGKLGFEAVPVPGYDFERFLVIAAPSQSALGPLASLRGECRLPKELARKLSKGEGLPPGTRTATAGYRISHDPKCPPPPPAGVREGVASALDKIPTCKLP